MSVGSFLETIMKEDVSKEVTLKQRPEWDERISWVDIWGKDILGRGNSKYKGPEEKGCFFVEGTAR